MRHLHSRRGDWSPTYYSWASMVQRCTNSKRNSYKFYGGRGITVCPRWLSSFTTFLADMGERAEGTSLDRIDSNGHYVPENCRWAQAITQGRNRRGMKLSPSDIPRIKVMSKDGLSARAIGKQFGVSDVLIGNILKGKTWRNENGSTN